MFAIALLKKIQICNRYILGLGNENTQVYFRCARPADVCPFGVNLLHLGNVGKQVYRRFLGLQMFHVKRLQGERPELVEEYGSVLGSAYAGARGPEVHIVVGFRDS